MSTREQLLYGQMKAKDPDLGPFEETFFFPTPADVALAKKARRFIGGLPSTDQRSTAVRLVAERAAVPAAYLRIVRELKDRFDIKP